jgi:glycosyltransferase involved in cell wall biosynthesis
MIIVVNTHFQANNHAEDYFYFLRECFGHIVKDHPEHTFIFISDKEYDKEFVFLKNYIPVVVSPLAKHPALRKLWYDIKLPGLLRKHRADVLVSVDGMCSLTTKLPQCLVWNNLPFLYNASSIPKSHLLFYRHYVPKFFKKAKQIITLSEISKQAIVSRYEINESSIGMVPIAANRFFKPVNDKEKELIKARFTGGKEYFICATHPNMKQHLLNVLKAFSGFKKMQNSNWKLVLTGSFVAGNAVFLKSLRTYKYKDDVVLTGDLPEEELASVVGSAYGLLNPSRWEELGGLVLEAMQSCVAVIIADNSAMQEIAGDAALYVDPEDHKTIAESMMRLYKDERLRSTLVEKAITIVSQYNFNRSAEVLWKYILDTGGRSET